MILVKVTTVVNFHSSGRRKRTFTFVIKSIHRTILVQISKKGSHNLFECFISILEELKKLMPDSEK